MDFSQSCGRCGAELAELTMSGYCASCLLRDALVGAAPEDGAQKLDFEGPKPTGTGQRFGNYELLEKLGQGGMGVVYKAKQINLDRIVAIKLLPFGQFSHEDVVRRFRVEAAAAAVLQHPNVVAIHDIGEEKGQHYFSMDYIEGQTLADVVREKPLPAKRAATYLKIIAEAVHYAHGRGILHRDLKPSNILVDRSDQPRITDFGLAKRLTVDSDMTLTGQVLGSPNFMAPEQAEGHSQAIGPASEVYSLGALLYHLLTRQPPFQADTLTLLLKQVMASDPVPPRQLNPSVPQDLETICLRCLEKEPRRRYQTAQDLADELGRFLAGQPVLARPVGFAGKAWRWCRRQPVRAGLIAALVVVFVAGSFGVLWQWRQARRNAQAEAHQRQLASKAAYVANLGLTESLINEGQFDRARELLLAASEAYRGWEWGWLQRSCNQDRLTLVGTNVPKYFAVFSPDVRLLATGGEETSIHFWELQTGREIQTLLGHKGSVLQGAFSPDGRHFASAGWGDSTARIWDTESGKALWVLDHPSGVKHVAFSPDGQRLVTACMDGRVRLWDPATGKPTGDSAPYGDSVECAEFSPDGKRVAYCGGYVFWGSSLDTSVRIWDLATGQTRRLEGHTEEPFALAWSPRGDLLASAGLDGQVILWEAHSGRRVGTVESPGDRKYAVSVAFSRDGRLLAVGGGQTLSLTSWVEIFDVETRRPIRKLSGHSQGVMQIIFSRDGELIATASLDGTVKVWPVQPVPPGVRLQGHDQVICAVAFSPDGRRIATGSFDQTARVWDAKNGHAMQTIPVCFPVASLAFSPDGKNLLTPGPDNSACIWKVRTEPEAEIPGAPSEPQQRLLGHVRAVMAVAWSPDGQWVATGSKDHTVRIWAASTGRERMTLAGHTSGVQALAFTWDSMLLATGSADHTIRFWDIRSGHCLRVLTNHTEAVRCLAFSPDRQWLASGSDDLTARVWLTETGRESIPPLQGHLQAVTSLAFSPDGQRLATASGGSHFHEVVSRDFHVRLWDARSGHQLLSLTPHTNTVHAVAFSPDGRQLLTGSFDNTAAVQTAFPWDSADYPGDAQAPPAARIEDYKRKLWRSASSNPQSASPRQQDTSPHRRVVRSWLGEINLPPVGAKTRPLRPIPPRPASANSNQLDLTACYNVALNESWQPADALDQLDLNLAALPAGYRTFAGVPFDVRGMVQLRRAAVDFELFPERVMFPVQRAFQRLHCLHATREDAEQGMAIAALVLHYADGTSTELPICYGVHLRQVTMASWTEPDCPQGEVAWKGPAPAAGDRQQRLYKSTFTNPNPRLEVLEIEYVSKLTRSGPFLVALTVK